MARLAFTVLGGPWGVSAGDGEGFAYGPFADSVEIDDADDALVRAAGSAHDAGAIEVTEGLDASHVQSQEDGERALAAAMGQHVVEDQPDGTRVSYWTGPWAEGNMEDFIASRGQLLARHDDPDDDFELDDDALSTTRANVSATERLLGLWRDRQAAPE